MQNTLPLLNTFYICMCLTCVAMIIVRQRYPRLKIFKEKQWKCDEVFAPKINGHEFAAALYLNNEIADL